ncbi:MAG: glycosyltransferase family 2 protein, partial [Bacteroidota bacterium]
KTILIDDGSTDGTFEFVKAKYPDIHVIKGNGSLWWTAATNLGVKYAIENGAEYLVTLNNDTVLMPDFFEKMIEGIKKEPTALIGALALNSRTMKPYYGGEIINWITAGSKKLLDVLPENEWAGLHTVSHYPGRGLLIPSEVFLNIGYYDEKRFPQRFSDDDFAHRAARAGYKIFCNFDAKLVMYPEACGDYEFRQQQNLKKYWQHLFSKKGSGNILTFTKFAYRNAPQKYFIFFLITGLTRRIFGYLRDWVIALLSEKK